jgi:hypothetical protein
MFAEKTEGRKSRETVPLSDVCYALLRMKPYALTCRRHFRRQVNPSQSMPQAIFSI